MVSKKKIILDGERTEQQPAQEKVASAAEAGSGLTAEQVYTQRITDNRLEGQISNPGFVP